MPFFKIWNIIIHSLWTFSKVQGLNEFSRYDNKMLPMLPQ